MVLRDWADLIQGLSIIIASGVAVYGIDAWRREFRGKRQIELAEEVLGLFYEARDLIEAIRNPLGFVGEGKTREPGPNERPEDKECLDRAFVLIERYNAHREPFAQIQSLRYRFMAVFGRGAVKPFDDLNWVLLDLLNSARRMATLFTASERAFRTEADYQKYHDQRDKVDRIFYGGGADDPVRPRVEQLLSGIESICRDAINQRWTLFNRRSQSRKG